MQKQLYDREKIDIVGELARIYKERVVEFQLKLGRTEYKWHDLIQRNDRSSAENLKNATCEYPEIRADLVTEVDRFIETHRVPIFERPPETVDFIDILIGEARSFRFRAKDSHQELARELCDLLEELNSMCRIPTKLTVQIADRL